MGLFDKFSKTFDKYGYDLDGYDKNGFDKKGYDKTDSVKPKNKLPESPMKIEAGGRLKLQNPIVTPPSITINNNRNSWPCHQQIDAKKAKATILNPLAKPSKPSIRLIAFIIPTIQKIVKGQEKNPKFII